MACLFPRHAVDRFLEHNVFYTMGQCTIQEGWNGFKRGGQPLRRTWEQPRIERNRWRPLLHPRKREYHVAEQTEDHDARPDQKLRSGSQSRARQDILPPPRHDRGTGVPAGVKIPAGCPAVAAMELDQQ